MNRLKRVKELSYKKKKYGYFRKTKAIISQGSIRMVRKRPKIFTRNANS